MQRRRTNPKKRRFLFCIANKGYECSLQVRKLYRALPDTKAERHGMIRVVDDSEEDYLYPRDWFVRITLPRGARSLFSKRST